MGDSASPKNPFPFFQNLNFKFPLPFLPKKEAETVEVVREEEEVEKKPGVVRFTYEKEVESAPPLKIEVEDESKKTSNPIILWQVYALGGFLILRWVWGRWQERKARKGSTDRAPDPEDSPADDTGSQ